MFNLKLSASVLAVLAFLCFIILLLERAVDLESENLVLSQEPVAHTYNPSYSGGRNQKNHSLKSGWANSSRTHISKKPITKKELVEWLKA
jgi:hypothetical protein